MLYSSNPLDDRFLQKPMSSWRFCFFAGIFVVDVLTAVSGYNRATTEVSAVAATDAGAAAMGATAMGAAATGAVATGAAAPGTVTQGSSRHGSSSMGAAAKWEQQP
jgi:hypothetical protein